MTSELLALKQILPLFIPIIAILGGVMLVIVAMVLDYRKKSNWLALHHKERLFALERGIELAPVPPEWLGGFKGAPERAPEMALRALRQGLLFLLVGLALSAALALNRDMDSAAWGLLPMAIGIANLVFARLARRETTAG